MDPNPRALSHTDGCTHPKGSSVRYKGRGNSASLNMRINRRNRSIVWAFGFWVVLFSPFLVLLVSSDDTFPLPATNFTQSPSSSSINTIYYSTLPIHQSYSLSEEIIVVFKRYLPRTEHQSVLSGSLGSEGTTWRLVPRNNPASLFPTDFALIKIAAGMRRTLMGFLMKNRDVKYVFPQKRFVGIEKEFSPPHTKDVNNDLSPTSSSPSSSSSSQFLRHLKGRKQTPFPEEEEWGTGNYTGMRKLHSSLIQVAHLLNADHLWDKGYTGKDIKVAIFDTGLRADHPHFRNIKERTNWTDENTLEDGLGHGTFVAGVIASQAECLGFAPDVDLHIFRVFTNDRVSYTSWFLDAFNYAIHTKINVLNLSIGGPDFMDTPFIEKVWEMSANNIIVVSAIGNDGPLYGTLNNPADQADVIGVGGINYRDRVASFSSRGMTTWELPHGYGRVKPDIVAYGKSVSGSRIYGGCRALSGTSVASPVVAGAVALLASTIPLRTRWDVVNPASMKQALIASAQLVPQDNIFEQGFGKLQIMEGYEYLQNYVPHASVIPSTLDLTDCPYMWPYCTQPIYHSGMPLIFNTTILNGMGVIGEIDTEPIFEPGPNGHLLEISFSYAKRIWPWTGWMSIRVRVSESGAKFEGEADGMIRFSVSSPPGPGESQVRTSLISLPLRVRIIPTPPRERRLLFDQFHNLRYPSGYFPRDALWVKDEPFDWNGDHIHTNFKDMYTLLREWGYYVEVLGDCFTCFNASNYATLLLVDPEEEYFPEEIAKLRKDIEENGLSLAVFADWYNTDIMRKIKFFDENTRQWWTPVTGGANIPALNDLLGEFGIAFGDRVYDGEFHLPSHDNNEKSLFASGAAIAKFPQGGRLFWLDLYDQTEEMLTGKSVRASVPVLGLVSMRQVNNSQHHKGGRIAVFGDSSCIDNAHQRQPCFSLLQSMVTYTAQGLIDDSLITLPPLISSTGIGIGTIKKKDIPNDVTSHSTVYLQHLDRSFYRSNDLQLPSRIQNTNNDITKYSKVRGPHGFYPLGANAVANCTRSEFKAVPKAAVPVVLQWKTRAPAVSMTAPHSTSSDLVQDPLLTQESFGSADNLKSYLIPYLIVCAAVVGLLIVTLRGRKDRILTKRVTL